MRSAVVDLSHIVDDVMGPSYPMSGGDPGIHYSQHSVSSSYRDLPGSGPGPGHDDPPTRELSLPNASQIALLEAAGLAGPARPSPLGQNENDAATAVGGDAHRPS